MKKTYTYDKRPTDSLSTLRYTKYVYYTTNENY